MVSNSSIVGNQDVFPGSEKRRHASARRRPRERKQCHGWNGCSYAPGLGTGKQTTGTFCWVWKKQLDWLCCIHFRHERWASTWSAATGPSVCQWLFCGTWVRAVGSSQGTFEAETRNRGQPSQNSLFAEKVFLFQKRMFIKTSLSLVGLLCHILDIQETFERCISGHHRQGVSNEQSFFFCFHFTFFFLCWQSGSMDLNLSALWWIVPRALHSQVVEKSRPLRLGKHCWFFMLLGWCIARISAHSIHNLYLQMSIMRFMSVVIYTSIYTTFASFQQTDQRNINNIRNNSSHKHTSQQELPLILRVLPVFPRMAMSGPGTKNLWMASIADSAKTCPERTNPDTIHCRSTHGMHWEWRQGPLEPWSMAHVCFCKRGVVGIHSLGRQPKRQDTRKPRNYSHHLYADTYGYIHVREDEVQWPYSGV